MYGSRTTWYIGLIFPHFYFLRKHGQMCLCIGILHLHYQNYTFPSCVALYFCRSFQKSLPGSSSSQNVFNQPVNVRTEANCGVNKPLSDTCTGVWLRHSLKYGFTFLQSMPYSIIKVFGHVLLNHPQNQLKHNN